ncbi:neutral/alkaline non-lysosomal ceramidase N-terminal domain-containing protein [Brucellaceae bacterium C25G]
MANMTSPQEIRAGVAVIDITPTNGVAMSGFAARTQPAIGTHDHLTVRALVVNDTALVVADIIGMSADMSARIRSRCALPCENIVISALHNHGGPVSMDKRLSIGADIAWLERLEDACVAAINQAANAQQPVSITAANGLDPDIGRNRRHKDGAVDTALPLIRLRDKSGKMLALVINYACHPVVLGADNLLWTADYPFYVREDLEKEYPGAIALFVTGAVGDVNTGHHAHASISLAAAPDRTYENAKRIGEKISQSALSAPEKPVHGTISVHNTILELTFERRESQSPQQLKSLWKNEANTADTARRALLHYWCEWAETKALQPLEPLTTRITFLNWAGIGIAALPGEIFAQSALNIRQALPIFEYLLVAGFSDDNPGYIPPSDEYSYGGYEVDEAHRYYGQSATFAPGCAELLTNNMIQLAQNAKVE